MASRTADAAPLGSIMVRTTMEPRGLGVKSKFHEPGYPWEVSRLRMAVNQVLQGLEIEQTSYLLTAPYDSGRVVGQPSLTGLWKVSP